MANKFVIINDKVVLGKVALHKQLVKEDEMEKIISIEEATFKNDDSYGEKEGFIINTSKQEIKLGIDNGQSCCEKWGYFMSEDDLSSFIGAELADIKIVDTQLKHNGDFNQKDMYEGDCMFVNLVTDRGTLQFVAYNEHNGYYGHDVCIISKQVTESYCL